MRRNVCSTVERTVRVLIGLAFCSLFFLLEGAAAWLGLLGVALILTAVVRYCPVSYLAGVNTCRTHRHSV
jgi:Inner membrane protein YgaP-like, transmembrane domain